MSSALKGVGELAYDPLGEAVFAVSLKIGSSEAAAIKRIPDHVLGSGAAWEHHN